MPYTQYCPFISKIFITVLKHTDKWEFCKLLDKKFIMSKKGFKSWVELALKHGWVKNEK